VKTETASIYQKNFTELKHCIGDYFSEIMGRIWI